MTMSEILIHYSNQALKSVRSVTQEPQGMNVRGDKPKGLWVSVQGDDDWYSWCQSESYGIGKLAYHVVLCPDANVLRIGTAQELDEFTEQFGIEKSWTVDIDWISVANKYQGILIAPYIWQRRLEGKASRWYYGWDCASGCIWDASAVSEVRRVPAIDPEGAEIEVAEEKLA